MRRSANRALLEGAGVFDTFVFLRSVGECKKTDLYAGIGRGSDMTPKLDRLEEAGLLRQTMYSRVTLLSLTDEGRQVADIIVEIEGIIESAGDRVSDRAVRTSPPRAMDKHRSTQARLTPSSSFLSVPCRSGTLWWRVR